MRNLSLLWGKLIQCAFFQPLLIIHFDVIFYLCLGLFSGLFSSGFPTKALHAFLFSPHRCHISHPSHPPWFCHSKNIWRGRMSPHEIRFWLCILHQQLLQICGININLGNVSECLFTINYYHHHQTATLNNQQLSHAATHSHLIKPHLIVTGRCIFFVTHKASVSNFRSKPVNALTSWVPTFHGTSHLKFYCNFLFAAGVLKRTLSRLRLWKMVHFD